MTKKKRKRKHSRHPRSVVSAPRDQVSSQASTSRLRVFRDLILPILLITTAVLVTYGNTLKNGFVHDDTAEILQNQYVHDFSHISDILTSSAWAFSTDTPFQFQAGSNYYRPVQYLLYAVLYKFFGTSAWGYHGFKILLHLCACYLSFWVARRLGLPPWSAFVGALLFAVHPANSEAVTWISGITDVSCALLFALCVLFYLNFLSSSRTIWLVLISSSFLIGLFAKETMATLVLVLIAYEWVVLGRAPWKTGNLRVYLLLGGACLLYFAMRIKAIGGFTAQGQLQYNKIGFFQGLLNQVDLLSQYFETFFYPANLNAFHLFDPIVGLFDLRLLKAILVLVLVLVAAVLLHKRLTQPVRPLLPFSLFWFILTLLPVLIFFRRIGENALAERYLYLPDVGLCLALSIPLAAMKTNASRAGTLGCVALAALLSWMTIQRNRVWHDELVFYETTLKSSPKASLLFNNLGNVYASKLMYEDALKAFNLSIAARPNWSAYKNLGPIYGALGRTDEAIAAYRQAIAIYPSDVEVYSGLGDLYFGLNRYPEAISVFLQALKLGRNYSRVWFNLGDACMIVGRYDEALRAYQEVLQVSPREAGRAYSGMANAYRALKLFDQAAEADKKSMVVQ